MEPFWLLAYKAPYKVCPLVSSEGARIALQIVEMTLDCPLPLLALPVHYSGLLFLIPVYNTVQNLGLISSPKGD